MAVTYCRARDRDFRPGHSGAAEQYETTVGHVGVGMMACGGGGGGSGGRTRCEAVAASPGIRN